MRRVAVLVLAPSRLAAAASAPAVSRGGRSRVHRLAGLRREPARADQPRAGAQGETVMRLLQRIVRRQDALRRRLRAVDRRRLAAGATEASGVDWFYYVNGIEADEGAGGEVPPGRPRLVGPPRLGAARCASRPSSGPSRSRSAPAEGQQLPIRLVCLRPRDALVRRGRDAAERRRRAQRRRARTSSPRRGEVLRILVGPLEHVRQDIAARQLEAGPRVSGVFAKPADGSRSRCWTPRRRGARSARVRARRGDRLPGRSPPTWLITGTDDVGVAAAAAALTEDQLRDHFALAIEAAVGRATGSRRRDTRARAQPAARHAREHRRRVVRRARRGRRWRPSIRSLLVAVLAVEASRRWRRGLGARAAADHGVGVPFALAILVSTCW